MMSGSMDLVKWLEQMDRVGPEWLADAWAVAVESGEVEMVEWIEAPERRRVDPKRTWTGPLISGGREPNLVQLALRGKTEMLAWLARRRPDLGLDAESLQTAIGDLRPGEPPLPLLAWVLAQRPQQARKHTVQEAARLGHLDVVEWACARGCYAFMGATEASQRGDLAVVEWLFQPRHATLPKWSIVAAASAGHLDLIEWFHARDPGSFPDDVFDKAITSGNTQLLDWLLVHRPERPSPRAIVAAAWRGDAETVEWLLRHKMECDLRAAIAATYMRPRARSVLGAILRGTGDPYFRGEAAKMLEQIRRRRQLLLSQGPERPRSSCTVC